MMPSYKYKAKDGPERIVEGVIEAASEVVAVEKISDMGLVPISVKTHDGSAVSSAHIAASSQKFSLGAKKLKQLILFTRHLNSLIRSGVSVFKAIHILADHEKDLEFKAVLNSAASQIKEGRSLSQALQSHPRHFSSLYVAIVHAGETSGGLEESLGRLAHFLKNQDLLRTKIKKAMAYPVLLALAGFGTIFYILSFVIPKLSNLFLNLGQELPLPTRVVMTMSGFMSHFWWVVLIGIACVIFGLPILFSRLFGKDYWEEWKLQMPWVRDFVFKVDFSRFSRTLEMTLSNGIPFIQAVYQSIPTLSNPVLRKAITEGALQVERGQTFALSLHHSSHFPEFVVNLIAVGEESGKLEEVLTEISDSYEEEIDEAVQLFSTLLEPMMILLVGAIVGFLVIAMLLPIFEVNTII